jgi:hypothetical protein
VACQKLNQLNFAGKERLSALQKLNEVSRRLHAQLAKTASQHDTLLRAQASRQAKLDEAALDVEREHVHTRTLQQSKEALLRDATQQHKPQLRDLHAATKRAEREHTRTVARGRKALGAKAHVLEQVQAMRTALNERRVLHNAQLEERRCELRDVLMLHYHGLAADLAGVDGTRRSNNRNSKLYDAWAPHVPTLLKRTACADVALVAHRLERNVLGARTGQTRARALLRKRASLQRQLCIEEIRSAALRLFAGLRRRDVDDKNNNSSSSSSSSKATTSTATTATCSELLCRLLAHAVP